MERKSIGLGAVPVERRLFGGRDPAATLRPLGRTWGLYRIVLAFLILWLSAESWAVFAQEQAGSMEDPFYVVRRRSAQELIRGIPASVPVEDVFRRILVESVHRPSRGPTLIANWQQEVVDLAAGEKIDTQAYLRLELVRRNLGQASGSRFSSTVRQNAEGAREARYLPGIGCVDAVQRGVLAELWTFDLETLVHMTSIYLGTYGRQTVPPPPFWLRDHTRDLVLELAEIHFEETGQLDVYVAKLMALADIQRSLVIYYDGLDALDLFELVLDLDDQNQVARYWAGFMSEKFGEYRQAVRHFERFLTVDPDDPEVRLRLAVNQLRTGRRTPGSVTLEQLAKNTETPAWMRKVAWSELVRQESERGGGPALSFLRQATESFPEEPSFQLQLAFHQQVDAWGESQKSLDRAVDLGPKSPGPGARVRYEQGRTEGLARNRAWLVEQAESRRGALLAALERLEHQWHLERNVPRFGYAQCDGIGPEGEK